VLDTWFSSALWPFSTLGWPDETPELKRFYPTDVLVTGFDIIFFWVARMMMMGLHFMEEGAVPHVYIHALVRDEKGAKMSKSKGNVIDPCRTDRRVRRRRAALHAGAMAAQGRDIKLSAQRVEGYRNFGTKLWNAARFRRDERRGPHGGLRSEIGEGDHQPLDLGETARRRRSDGRHRSLPLQRGGGRAYRFVWNIFCDWYLELSKPILTGPDEAALDETRAMTAWTLDQILKLLHPFMPFITEELWLMDETVVALPLAGVIDFAAEKARLNKELDKTARDIAAIEGRLNNPGFVAKAPPEVIEEAKERREELTARAGQVKDALGRLAALG
jgi:valyl-tRNA synthetase